MSVPAASHAALTPAERTIARALASALVREVRRELSDAGADRLPTTSHPSQPRSDDDATRRGGGVWR